MELEHTSIIMWRSAQQACDLIKERDKDSGITRFYITKLANSGQIRSLKTGRKLLVDVMSLISYLNGTPYEFEAKQLKV